MSYRELTGCAPLRPASTPFLEDVDKVERVANTTATPPSGDPVASSDGKAAGLSNVAARVLMKLL